MDAFNNDKKGSLEFLHGHAGRCRAWRGGAHGGYVTGHGGFTQKARQALVFAGPGEAISQAQRLGFAITGWWR